MPAFEFTGSFKGPSATDDNDVSDVVSIILKFAAEQMKRSGKFTYGDKLMLKLKIRPRPKPATKGKTKAAACVVKAKP